MDAQTTDAAKAELDEFLGTPQTPRWHRWAKWAAIALGALLLIWLAIRFFGGEAEAGYITEEVRRGDLALTVAATGNLAPTNQVAVGSELSGTIDRVLVDVNDRVIAGQPLAIINTEILDDQITQSRAALNARVANVAQAQATVSQAQASLNRLREVSRLSGGRVPARVEMETAEADVARAVAALRSAQAEVVSAQAQLASNNTQRGKAVVRAPVAGVVLSRQIEPGQTVAASFSTPTLFVIAEDLSAMQLEVAIDEADVGQVREGQEATFTVDAYPGRTFPARIERVDLASSSTAANASSSSSTTTASTVIAYNAILTVANPDGQLRPGMTATADIAVQSTRNALLVPNAALRFNPEDAARGQDSGGLMTQMTPQRGRGGRGGFGGRNRREQQRQVGEGSRATVYVIGENGEPSPIEVVTGASDSRNTAVTSEQLRPGMQVITSVRAADAGSGEQGR